MVMDHPVNAVQNGPSNWTRLLRGGRFSNESLEQTFRKYSQRTHRPTILQSVWLFILLLFTLTVLHLSSTFSLSSLSLVLLTLSLFILGVLGGRNLVTDRLFFFGILQTLTLFVAISLPINYSVIFSPWIDIVRISAVDGVSSLSVVIFAVYSVFPVDTSMALLFGLVTSVMHTLMAGIFVDLYSNNIGRQLAANLVVFLWMNGTGLYMHIVRRRLDRSSFVAVRNCISTCKDVSQVDEHSDRLLARVLPTHMPGVLKKELSRCDRERPVNALIQYYNCASVMSVDVSEMMAKIAANCTAQDTVLFIDRIFAEFDQMAQQHHCIPIRSMAGTYFAISGIPLSRSDHPSCCVLLALTIVDIIRNIAIDHPAWDLPVRIGVDTGSVVGGIVGFHNWHYDVYSKTVENALRFQSSARPNNVLISETTMKMLDSAIEIKIDEQMDERGRKAYSIARSLREDDGTVGSKDGGKWPQSRPLPSFSGMLRGNRVNRVNRRALNDDAKQFCPRRRRNLVNRESTDDLQLFYRNTSNLLYWLSLKFKDRKLERQFHRCHDSWFLPGIFGCIIFLVLYSIYHWLVLPQQSVTSMTILTSSLVLSSVLLVLYLDYFRIFRRFIARTFCGHLLAILLLSTLMFTCGITGAFACPLSANFQSEPPDCPLPQYILLSCLLWLMLLALFVRFCHLLMLILMLIGVSIYSIQIFVTHRSIYLNYSVFSKSTVPCEFELLLSILTLITLIFVQARRNERTMRVDFLWKFQETEDRLELQKLKACNLRLLLNMLPHHLAVAFLNNPNENYHGTHRLGVAYLSIQGLCRFHSIDNCQEGQKAMQMLCNIVVQFDKLLDDERYKSIEKINSVHYSYLIVVGLNSNRNICHDAEMPTNLTTLVEFILDAKFILARLDMRLELNAGIDLGSVVVGVVGGDTPQLDIWSQTVVRAISLGSSIAAKPTIRVSDGVYFALRNKCFVFERTVDVADSYVLTGRRMLAQKTDVHSHSPHVPRIHQTIVVPSLTEILAAKYKLTAAIANAESSESSQEEVIDDSWTLLFNNPEKPAKSFVSALFRVADRKLPSVLMQTSMTESDLSTTDVEIGTARNKCEKHPNTDEHGQICHLQQLLHAQSPDPQLNYYNNDPPDSMISSISSSILSTDIYNTAPLETEAELEWITPKIAELTDFDENGVHLGDHSDKYVENGSIAPNPCTVGGPLIRNQRKRRKRGRKDGRLKDLIRRLSTTSHSELEYRPSPRLLSWLNHRKSRRNSSPSDGNYSSDSNREEEGLMRDQFNEMADNVDKVEGMEIAIMQKLWINEHYALHYFEMLLELCAVHADLPESDQLQRLRSKSDTLPFCRPFPTTCSFLQNDSDDAQQPSLWETQHRHNRRQRQTGSSAAQTEYENVDSDYFPCSETESQLHDIANLRPMVDSFNRSVDEDDDILASSPHHPMSSSLDYLDPGHEADVDSLCSSRASSRIFFDESQPFVFSRRKNDNRTEQRSSSYHIVDPSNDQSDKMRQLARDIEQNFGHFKLASFSDVDN